jgi:hypothetical protein
MRLALIWGEDYLPFSPSLLLFLIDGFASATATEFIMAVSPEVSQRLSTWPPPFIQTASGENQLDIQVGNDLMNMIIDLLPNMQVRPS